MTTSFPLNFPDVVSEDDLDSFASEITSDLQGLEQDVAHMLEEPPGSNLDDLTRGAGVGQLLSGPDTNLQAAAQRIDLSLQQDDRVSASSTVITKVAEGSYVLAVTIEVSGTVLPLNYAFTATGGLQRLP